MVLPDDVFISTSVIFSICDSPQKSSAAQKVYRADGLALSVTFGDTSPIGRGFRTRAGGMCSSVFLFVEKCAIISLRPCPPTLFGREVKAVIHILTILESVIANVISHYICKWLDRLDKDRKPD